MNNEILEKYGLTMSKLSSKFDGLITGNPIGNYIYTFKHPEDIDDFVSDINLAISGNFSQIIDPDYSGGLGWQMGNHWFAHITPTHFELWQDQFTKTIIPLEDWKQILLSWKACVE
ncbi:hypothetical protein [Polluticaenibacter yanchengensis]|uniref:Uncharacterized protein n=1 Tax=Polluticaenibacter yanchengensis TaxID=3014562 RepID=A0ABT4UPU4_9BACT|nr:hypothetical protein [Chitinophagaceae bacterium LY-5]